MLKTIYKPVGGFVNYLTEKILYLWVRSDSLVMPGDGQSMEDGNVVYVLEYRSWTNLLILHHECKKLGYPSPFAKLGSNLLRKWHSVYTVAPKAPFLVWLFNEPKRSKMLDGLLEALKQNDTEDVLLVPVSIFWGRPVSKQKHWLAILFAESWRVAGRTRKLFTIVFHGRHTLVKFSEPVRLRKTVNLSLANELNIDRLQGRLTERLNQARTATLGPDVSHRRTLVNQLMQVSAVKQAIEEYKTAEKVPQFKASKKARRYLYEIVADCTTITIQVLQRGLTAFWNKFYSGIEVNHFGDVKYLAATHSIVYVPCHRSHIDYLLLSYVIHQQGLALPYIAAGKNLNIPVIGPILRGGGAFFIRRSFKGNPLYATLLFEYLAMLLYQGIPTEYFVEGGRSRTGRLLKPKPGMLSMTVRGFLKYRQKPVVFVPVYVGYEKMIEGKAYIAELLGRKKKKESLSSAIKSMLSIRGQFGKVTTNFGEPIYLASLLDVHHPGWAGERFDDSARPQWLMHAVSDLGRRIMTEINRATAVNATNLVSTVVIASPSGHMDAGEMARLLDLYSGLIKYTHYSSRVTVTALTGEEQIARVESLALIKRRSHPLGDILYASEQTAPILNYYRNNTLHLLALPSLLACCFQSRQSLDKRTVYHLITLAYPFLQSELFVEWREDGVEYGVDKTLDYFTSNALLVYKENKSAYARPVPGSVEFGQLQQLANVILPVIELYFIVATILLRHQSGDFAQGELEELCYLTVQRYSLLYKRSAIDYLDRKLVVDFIDALVRQNHVTIKNQKLHVNHSLAAIGRDLRILLSPQMRMTLLDMMKGGHRMTA